MPQISSISGTASVAQLPSGGQTDIADLVLAVQQAARQEKQAKQQEAAAKLQTMIIMKQQGVMAPPKEWDKTLKEMGLDFTFDQISVMTPEQLKQMAGQAAGAKAAAQTSPMQTLAPTAQQPLPPSIKPQDVARTGNVIQGNKAGAQAAAPPSPAAANAAPGGGVGAVAPAPGSGYLQHLLAQSRAQYPQFTQMFADVMSQQQMAAAQAEKEAAITANWRAFNQGDYAAGGRAIVMSGGKIDDETMRSLMISAGTPDERERAIDFLTGGMTPEKIAERRNSVIKDLATNPTAVTLFRNKEDIFRVADAVAQNQPIPKLAMNPFTLEQQKNMAEEAFKWVTEYGFPPSLAWQIAEKRALGMSTSQIFPEGFDAALFKAGFVPLTERKQRVSEKEASAKLVQAEAQMLQAKTDAGRLAQAEQEAKDKKPFQLLSQVVDMKKAGMDVPDTLEQEALASVTMIPGLGMTAKRVNNVLHFLTGGYHYEFEPTKPGEAGKATREGTAGKPQPGVGVTPGGAGFTPEMAGRAAVGTATDIAKLPYRAVLAGWEAEKAAILAGIEAGGAAAKEATKRFNEFSKALRKKEPQ